MCYWPFPTPKDGQICVYQPLGRESRGLVEVVDASWDPINDDYILCEFLDGPEAGSPVRIDYHDLWPVTPLQLLAMQADG